MHFIFKSLVAAVLILTGPILAHAAQDEAEQMRAFTGWTLEVSETTSAVITAMDAGQVPDSIAAAYRNGEISASLAYARLAEWREDVDRDVAALQEQAERLAQGPAQTPGEFGATVDAMADIPLAALSALKDFLSESENYARDVLAGRETSANPSIIARLSVLQTYYEAQIRSNRLALQSVPDTHPQYHLLAAMNLNMSSSVLLFEQARQALGGAPSRHAVADFPAAIRANQAAVREAAATGRGAQQALINQFTSAPASALGGTEEQLQVLIAMMETYSPSFDAELDGARLHSNAIERLEDDPEIATSGEIFSEELVAYEAQREALQIQRQRLANQL